jgi:hypothetical protein
VGAPRLPRAVGSHRLDRRVLLTAAEHHLCRFRLEPPLLPLETAEHHRRLRPPLSACHGTRHLAQWTRTEMSGGREREGGTPSRGELTWWRSRIPHTARCGGGGRATLRSTATHPSATPSRATPTSCSALASAWTCGETERDRERAREDKDGPRPRVGIRPCPRGDKGGRFFSPSAWWVQNFRRLLVSIDVSSRYQK